MHLLSAAGGAAVLLLGLLCEVSSMETVVGVYGETLEVPCKNGGAAAENHLFFKWKYEKEDRQSGDLMTKQKDQAAVVIAEDEYRSRVSMADNSSLFITNATLSDQKTFTCIEVAGARLDEYAVKVVIHKAPSRIDVVDQADELEIGKLAKIGQCNAVDANPAVNITWYKNGIVLSPDGKGVDILTSVQVDPVTGLSTTSSTLRYSAGKGDAAAGFTCGTVDLGGRELLSSAVTFTITYPTEHVSLKVIPEGELLEGHNVTLKCVADGNPPPTTFNFFIKGELVNVVDSDSYTMTDVTRNASGEYRCSLAEKPSLEASANIIVSYLDVELTPSGEVVKRVGDSLNVALKTQSSAESKVSWTKDNLPYKTENEPAFKSLTYADAGLYEGQVTLGTLRRAVSFKLTVEGAPVVRHLTKSRGDTGRQEVLSCEAEGFPKPSISWSVNGSLLQEGAFANGRITHQITVVPAANLTVYCTAFNELGQHTQGINVSSIFEEVRMDKQDQSGGGDQTKLVVGVVVGLLLATVIVGLAYWVYMKKAKQGSWKTGELENGSSEEEKKLEEKVEENSQKADM